MEREYFPDTARDTLKQIAEDCFLTAYNVREGDLGEDIDPDDGEFVASVRTGQSSS